MKKVLLLFALILGIVQIQSGNHVEQWLNNYRDLPPQGGHYANPYNFWPEIFSLELHDQNKTQFIARFPNAQLTQNHRCFISIHSVIDIQTPWNTLFHGCLQVPNNTSPNANLGIFDANGAQQAAGNINAVDGPIAFDQYTQKQVYPHGIDQLSPNNAQFNPTPNRNFITLVMAGTGNGHAVASFEILINIYQASVWLNNHGINNATSQQLINLLNNPEFQNFFPNQADQEAIQQAVQHLATIFGIQPGAAANEEENLITALQYAEPFELQELINHPETLPAVRQAAERRLAQVQPEPTPQPRPAAPSQQTRAVAMQGECSICAEENKEIWNPCLQSHPQDMWMCSGCYQGITNTNNECPNCRTRYNRDHVQTNAPIEWLNSPVNPAPAPAPAPEIDYSQEAFDEYQDMLVRNRPTFYPDLNSLPRDNVYTIQVAPDQLPSSMQTTLNRLIAPFHHYCRLLNPNGAYNFPLGAYNSLDDVPLIPSHPISSLTLAQQNMLHDELLNGHDKMARDYYENPLFSWGDSNQENAHNRFNQLSQPMQEGARQRLANSLTLNRERLRQGRDINTPITNQSTPRSTTNPQDLYNAINTAIGNMQQLPTTDNILAWIQTLGMNTTRANWQTLSPEQQTELTQRWDTRNQEIYFAQASRQAMPTPTPRPAGTTVDLNQVHQDITAAIGSMNAPHAAWDFVQWLQTTQAHNHQHFNRLDQARRNELERLWTARQEDTHLASVDEASQSTAYDLLNGVLSGDYTYSYAADNVGNNDQYNAFISALNQHNRTNPGNRINHNLRRR